MAKKTSENVPEEEEWLTVPEAAKLKGVTESRVYQWISEGRLQKQVDERFGRTLVSRTDLNALQYLRRGRPRKQTPATEKKGKDKK